MMVEMHFIKVPFLKIRRGLISVHYNLPSLLYHLNILTFPKVLTLRIFFNEY